MGKRLRLTLAAWVIATGLALPNAIAAQGTTARKSATRVTDVNGFRLGMTVAEANSLAPMVSNGGQYFVTNKDGIEYDFSVTPKGRIYRITTTQNLGKFEIDQQFLTTLRRRLTAKYGVPSHVSGEVFFWNLTEPVADEYGTVLPFTTMSVSAMVAGDDDGQTLEIFMIDYRIRWADEAAVNHQPRASAEGRIQF